MTLTRLPVHDHRRAVAALDDSSTAGARGRVTPDQDGRAEAVNILTPLPESGYWLRRLALFPAFNFGSPSRLRSFAFLNFAHVAAMRHFPYLGPPQEKEELRFRYAIYCGDFVDGIREYVERFADSIPWQMDLLFSGSPGMFKINPHADAWVQNILAHSFPSLYYYSAYPSATVNDIRNALALTDKLRDFMEATEGCEARDFVLAYESFAQRAACLLGRVAGIQVPDGHPGGLVGRPGRRPDGPRWIRNARRMLGTFADQLRTSLVGDRVGRHCMLTFVLPVLAGREKALKQDLRSLPPKAFESMTNVHFARFALLTPQVVDRALRGRPADVSDELLLPSDARKLEPVGLKSNYVVFAVDTDADFDALVRGLSRDMRSIDAVLQHCVRYPGLDSHRDLKRWLSACRVWSYFAFADSPDHSVPEIRHALVIQRAFTDFAVDLARQPATSDSELQRRFGSLVDQLLGVRGVTDAAS